MAVCSPNNTPEQNLEILKADLYPGRMILQGIAGGVVIQASLIEGRSFDSGNRFYDEQDDIISTEVFDKSKPAKHPHLTIYDAQRRYGSVHIVSNGDQTSTAIQYLRSGRTFEEAMKSREYEDDEPNYTPRISGFMDLDPKDGQPRFGMSLIRRMPTAAATQHYTKRDFWTEESPEISLVSGVGYALQTYQNAQDEGQLPSFEGAPYPLPIDDTAEGTARLLFENLRQRNFVALAVKAIDAEGNIEFKRINKLEQ